MHARDEALFQSGLKLRSQKLINSITTVLYTQIDALWMWRATPVPAQALTLVSQSILPALTMSAHFS